MPYVTRMASTKADVVAGALRVEGDERWVLAADTIVEVDGQVLGKADSPAQATAMLARLVGRSHRVTTAFALRGPDSEPTSVASRPNHIVRAVTTEVTMRPASAEEIAGYIAAGEWCGKAGAYAVQGMAAALVARVDGSITNVIGLPLAEVLALLAELNICRPRYQHGVPA